MNTELRGNATQSFWIGASYLLSICISQPVLYDLSRAMARTSVTLLSIVLFASGSLLCADAGSLIVLLVGRCVQGSGAGGLTVLSYAAMGSLQPQAASRYASVLSVSTAAGTVCGPLLGAVLSTKYTWVWRSIAH